MKRTTMALWAVTLAVLVGTTARASDEQIATQIIERLQQQKQASSLEGFNIGVQVEQGTVTVMGTVAQTEHALMALDVARRVPGVKLVVNDLFIQPAAAAAVAQSQPSPAIATASATSVATKSPAVSAPSSSPIAGLEVTSAPSPAASSTATSGPPIGNGTFWGTPQPTAKIEAPPQRPIARQPAERIPTPRQPVPPAAGRVQVAAMPREAAQSLAIPRPTRRMTGKPVAFAPATSLAARHAGFNGPPEHPRAAQAQYGYPSAGAGPSPVAMGVPGGGSVSQASYDNPQMPGYAWPSYAAYPNYAALTYPHQYSATAWPYIGPFYPYPQVPLGWRKVSLEWDDGWWFLDFKSKTRH